MKTTEERKTFMQQFNQMSVEKQLFCILVWGAALAMLLTILFHSFDAKAQDTVPVTIVAEDITFRPDIWYYVDDAYDTNSIDSTKISNHYNQEIPGWDIDGTLYDLRFNRIDPKYVIETTLMREWKTIEGTTRQEIWYDGQMYVIDSGTIYFQQPGHFKNK